MNPFSPRPLARLFFIATACIDLLIATHSKGELLDSFEAPVFGVFIGQIWLAGAWLALGHSHRLARGAGFVLAMLGLTTVIALGQDSAGMTAADWGEPLAAIAIMGAATALASGGADLTLRSLSRSKRDGRDRVRFPIIELFGWTIVVAVASWASTAGNFARLTNVPESLIYALSSSITAGVAAALASQSYAGSSLLRKAMAAALVIGFVAAVAALGGVPERDLYHGVHWAFGYLGLFIVVGRVPPRRETSPEACSAQ